MSDLNDSPVSSTLVSLNPPTTLVFNLERGKQPKAVLKVTNVSSSKIVFKVKTTQPTWYYVRPNQQMLPAGKTEDVKILLVETECDRFLDQAAANKEEKLDKHRFLVQSKIIGENDYTRILTIPVEQRSDEFSKLWEGSKDDRKNIKLKVDFKYPDATAASTPSSGKSTTMPPVSENVRSKLSVDNPSNTPSANGTGDESSMGNNLAELQALRKKYDAVVEYTVHLTAERDAIVSQLDTSQRELAKEKNGKRKDSGKLDSKSESGQGGDRKTVEKGFSLFVVLFTALVCFLIGKYLS